MLLALALMTQDVTLNADASQAIACGRAVVATRPASGPVPVPMMLQAVYFMMIAAKADPGKAPRFLDRATEVAPLIFKDGSAATVTLADCDQRYPLARSTAPVKLPTDPFDRDLTCVAASSYAFGILQGAGVTSKAAEYQRIQEGFLTHIPDTLLARHGIKSQDDIVGAMDSSLRATLSVGNLEAILAACVRQLAGK